MRQTLIVTKRTLYPRDGEVYASITTNEFEHAKIHGKNVKIEYGKDSMTIDFDDLDNYSFICKASFPDSYKPRDYKLVNYPWRPE